MGTVLKKAAPDAPNPGGYYDVWADQAAELQARLNAPQQPLRSPEEVARLRAENDKQYQLGLLAQLSGDENLQGLGGQIFKQALAGRQPKQTEKGVLDPFTGQFTYNPEYQQEMTQAQLDKINTMRAQGYQQWLSNRQAAQERAAQDQKHMQMMAVIKSMGQGGGGGFGGPSMSVGIDASGNPLFRHTDSGRLFRYGPDGAPQWVTPGQPGQAQAAPGTTGAAAPANAPGAPFIRPKPSSAEPSEGERQAAGWLNEAQFAYKNLKEVLKKYPEAAQQSPGELMLSGIPWAGDPISYATMTPARQKYTTAIQAFSDPVLRAATGAGQTEGEVRRKINQLMPRYGEDAMTSRMKEQMLDEYLKSLFYRAGRAAPPGSAPPNMPAPAAPGAPAGGNPNDPWGVR